MEDTKLTQIGDLSKALGAIECCSFTVVIPRNLWSSSGIVIRAGMILTR